MASTIHETKWGTYHPGADDNGAWTVNDTRGYLDGGPSCDECGACECGDCQDCGLPEHECDCAGCEGGECIGLSFAYVCIDGGEALCEECFYSTDEDVNVTVIPCDCEA